MTTSRVVRSSMVLLAMIIVATGWSAPQPARAEEPAKVLLLLDVSGSMNERISSGGTKFAAAKRALKQVAGALPAGTQVGLRVYGSEISESKDTNPKACRDTELVMPIGPLDRSKMYKAVDSFDAVGETPIAYSLGKAVDDLGDKGRRVLVLISDGEESCAGDPCPAARKLADNGVDLQFNAIGLDVGSKARKQLKCIAQAGDGSYYDADEADDLSEALRKLTERALRPFAITGTPVIGTEDPATAPQLTVGQYRDRFGAGDGQRFYRISRRPGDTVTASVNSLVPPTGNYNGENWDLTLATEGGEACDAVKTVGETGDTVVVVSAAVRSGSEAPECTTDPLVLSVERRSSSGNDKAAAAEILVATEPEIVNTASLPTAITSYDESGRAVPTAKSTRQTGGGTSFTNAPLLAPGSYNDAPAVGESVFYKVRLEAGQRLLSTVAAPSDRDSWDLSNYETLTVATVLYSPSRVPQTKQSAAMQGDNRVKITAFSPQVRVRNREIAHGSLVTTEGDARANASYASVAGDYYVSVQVRSNNADLAGRVLPIRVNVAVDGRPAGQAQYGSSTEPTPSASASPSTSSSPTGPVAPPSDAATPPTDAGPGWGVVGIAAGVGAAVAALAGLGIALAVRRTRRSRASSGPTQ
ncbi:MAG TPA: VWA domain-containing protein [Microlunatus sp.]|nr:VWA domain-containing protein [Microlunatus sp.]